MTLDSTSAESRARRMAHIAETPFKASTPTHGFFRGSLQSLTELWRHRELLGRLVRREIRARYKDSRLGVLWSLFRPLVQLLIYYFAIGGILGAARQVPDFAIFVFIGLTAWTLYSEILSSSVRSILDNAGLVKKVYLPREIFPLSTVGSALVNFGVQLVVLLVGIAVLAHFVISPNLLLAPLALVTLLVFATAVGLLISALNVYLRDVQHLIEVYLIIFFWASPIVYPYTFVVNAAPWPWLSELYLANPVTLAIVGLQRALWAGGADDAQIQQIWPAHLEVRLLIALLVSLVALYVAQRIFARLQGNFAQEL